MFSRFSNTWAMMGDSWEILKQDKEILLFPLISGICCILVMTSFAIPVVAGESWQPPAREAAMAEQVAYYSTLFLFYFANYFVITFFNVAIIACASKRIQGYDPTLADGFKAAFSRFHVIFGWALLSATVGLVLRIIEDRSEKVGRFVAGLLGMAWSVVTYLAVPVIVMENKSPVAALKESTRLLRKTWGAQLIGNFSFGMVFFALGIPFILLLAAGFVLLHSGSVAFGATVIVLGLVYAIVLALVQSALQCIFQASLYYYASDNQTSGGAGISQNRMRDAFYQK